jgi:hypothetical protein
VDSILPDVAPLLIGVEFVLGGEAMANRAIYSGTTTTLASR